MKKIIFALSLLFVIFFGITSIASAHVVVRPSEAGISSFQTFVVGVPTEKDIPTVGLQLVMPPGLSEVSPTVKSGWKVDVKKDGTDEDANVTEIDWTGGTIPPGERDEFSFSAQVPSSETTLMWKAYQTYQDGTVVAWDENPSDIKAGEEGTPYSTTLVENDLTTPSPAQNGLKNYGLTAFALSILALIFSLIAFSRTRKLK